mmetsp:Transcript_18820/g.22231  ORF Transcript_18820/g.22231 Transcript_18820/m.22231 type:complete len:200 (-) Transcript_18820:1613-2212(-)
MQSRLTISGRSSPRRRTLPQPLLPSRKRSCALAGLAQASATTVLLASRSTRAAMSPLSATMEISVARKSASRWPDVLAPATSSTLPTRGSMATCPGSPAPRARLSALLVSWASAAPSETCTAPEPRKSSSTGPPSKIHRRPASGSVASQKRPLPVPSPSVGATAWTPGKQARKALIISRLNKLANKMCGTNRELIPRTP